MSRLEALKAAVDRHQSLHPEQRPGQALSNVLYQQHPHISEVIDGSDDDPFYNDSCVPRCWARVEQLLCDTP